jgi:hypothetical protein
VGVKELLDAVRSTNARPHLKHGSRTQLAADFGGVTLHNICLNVWKVRNSPQSNNSWLCRSSTLGFR